jgi:hypothetical protein
MVASLAEFPLHTLQYATDPPDEPHLQTLVREIKKAQIRRFVLFFMENFLSW